MCFAIYWQRCAALARGGLTSPLTICCLLRCWYCQLAFCWDVAAALAVALGTDRRSMYSADGLVAYVVLAVKPTRAQVYGS